MPSNCFILKQETRFNMLKNKECVDKIVFVLTLLIFCVRSDETFKQNLGDQMKIGLSEGGYKSVKLKCGSNSMHVHLETEDDFSGVIYTRGSFHDKHSPCFLDPGYKRGQRSFSIKFGLDKCKTVQKDDVYSNVLVLQHDKDLIMPGDTAFNLECDFRTPREVAVKAKLNNKQNTVISRITLTDADPGARLNRNKRSSVESHNKSVILTPNIITITS